MPEEKRAFSIREIQSRLGVSGSTVRMWIHTGKLAAYRLPGSSREPIYRVDTDVLERFLADASGVAQSVPRRQHTAGKIKGLTVVGRRGD